MKEFLLGPKVGDCKSSRLQPVMGLLSMFKLQTFEASGDWSSPLIAEYGPMSSLIELVEEMELVVKEVDLKIKQRTSIPFKNILDKDLYS